MLFKDVNKILESRYMPMETGYCKLPNGHYFFSVLARMPGCKIRWLKWWFGQVDQSIENPAIHDRSTKKYFRNLKNGIFHYQGKYLMDRKKLDTRLRPVDVSRYFDEKKASTIYLFSPGDDIIIGKTIEIILKTAVIEEVFYGT